MGLPHLYDPSLQHHERLACSLTCLDPSATTPMAHDRPQEATSHPSPRSIYSASPRPPDSETGSDQTMPIPRTDQNEAVQLYCYFEALCFITPRKSHPSPLFTNENRKAITLITCSYLLHDILLGLPRRTTSARESYFPFHPIAKGR